MPSSPKVIGIHTERPKGSRLLPSLAMAALLGTGLWGQTSQQAPKAASTDSRQPVSFAEHILPVFQKNCLLCHSGENSATSLDLSTREGLLRGGKRGPAVVPGDPQGSLLHQVVAHEAEPFMPQGGEQLSPEVIARIADWISAGTPYGESPQGQTAGAESTSGESTVFVEHIRPLLENVCLNCHSGEDKASGLDLSTRDSLLRGGNRGPAIVVNDPESSLLYKVVAREAEPHMPFMADQLPAETINYLAEWIREGASYTGTVQAAKSSLPGSDHWAYQLVTPPAVPTGKSDDEWVLNPIDAFVAAEHEKRGLRPLPPAGKRVLLRRVYLDLIGVPPTPEEIRAFLADDSSDAYEKVVDRLLANQQYGERWGRHWMDIWRYSDWYGFQKQKEVRNSQKHIWRWRDWIIESLNQDKGYDRMVIEMLAGDEVAPTDPKVLRATGYLARSWYKFNRTVWLQDTVEYVATSFLGTTIKCARCHDHKYDPILQSEYYRLRAFFEPHGIRVDRVPGEPDLDANGLARAFDGEPAAPTYRFLQGNEDKPDKEHPLTPGVPRILGGDGLDFRQVDVPVGAYYPDLRAPIRKDLLARARTQVEQADTELIEAKRALVNAKRRLVHPSEAEDVPASGISPVDTDVGTRAASVLSEEESLAASEKAEVAVTIAEKKLRALQAELPALEARMAADLAAYGLDPAADAEMLAEKARKLERKARLASAQANLLEAEQELAEALNPSPSGDEDSVKEKKEAVANEGKVRLAQKKLQAALDDLGKATDGYTPVGETYPKLSTGRRLALARWIASTKNPLTARVAINHIWGRHFSEPLVSTIFNFGPNGKPPTHPELLDWLASGLMENNWSMKAIHRLIVTSNTYRMRSFVEQGNANLAIDKDNVYLWRRKPLRMEAELVRDSILHVAGKLDTRMGGPEIEVTEQEESRRRSLYFYHSPDAQLLILKLFDAADPNECFRRNVSITPHQALALSNSKLSHTMSRLLARRLTEEVGDTGKSDPRLIDKAFEVVLGRPPSAKERAESRKFLVEQSELYGKPEKLKPFESGPENNVAPSEDPSLRARESLVHVLFNHDEFVTIR